LRLLTDSRQHHDWQVKYPPHHGISNFTRGAKASKLKPAANANHLLIAVQNELDSTFS